MCWSILVGCGPKCGVRKFKATKQRQFVACEAIIWCLVVFVRIMGRRHAQPLLCPRGGVLLQRVLQGEPRYLKVKNHLLLVD